LKWIATVESAFYKKKGNKSFAYIFEYVFKYWTDWPLRHVPNRENSTKQITIQIDKLTPVKPYITIRIDKLTPVKPYITIRIDKLTPEIHTITRRVWR